MMAYEPVAQLTMTIKVLAIKANWSENRHCLDLSNGDVKKLHKCLMIIKDFNDV